LAFRRHAAAARTPGSGRHRAHVRPGGKPPGPGRQLSAPVGGLAGHRGRALRHSHRGLRQSHREFPASFRRAFHRQFRHADLRSGRLHQGHPPEGLFRTHLQGALSQRIHLVRPGVAPHPGILPRFLLAARHHPALPQTEPQHRGAAGIRRHPAQRHPPGPGRGRTHAAARGRTPGALGPGLEHYHPDLRLHQSHAHARIPGNVARGHAPKGSAPPSPDHLRNQPALPGPDPAHVPRRRRQAAPHVADRGKRRQAGAHGPPGRGGLPLGQRRVQAPLRAGENHAVPGLRRPVAGEIQQQDQRDHA